MVTFHYFNKNEFMEDNFLLPHKFMQNYYTLKTKLFTKNQSSYEEKERIIRQLWGGNSKKEVMGRE